MASVMSNEDAEFFKHFLEKHEPYSATVIDGMMFDDKRFDEERLKATMALICLLKAGFSEDEVNPWKNKPM